MKKHPTEANQARTEEDGLPRPFDELRAQGGPESDFMRQENKIRGNTRTLRRQYAARNQPSVRVLPGIAGYCRVVGPGEKVDLLGVDLAFAKATAGWWFRAKITLALIPALLASQARHESVAQIGTCASRIVVPRRRSRLLSVVEQAVGHGRVPALVKGFTR